MLEIISKKQPVGSVSDVLGGERIRIAVMRVTNSSYCSTRSDKSCRSKKMEIAKRKARTDKKYR